jgi:hypothetical protein
MKKNFFLIFVTRIAKKNEKKGKKGRKTLQILAQAPAQSFPLAKF